MIRLYTPVFALTLLLSAALLFSVQPMFSKMVLPLLGGTPQVWNTAMLFFQLCLLGGYAYAHGTSRFLSVRAQAILHLVLLGVFAFVLPFGIPEGWRPPAGTDPTFWQLSLMAATVGGPFFVLAGSAPMLQRWFTVSGHPDSGNPYFLYGASNLGSMTALLAYPTLIEPFLTLGQQAQDWALGYFALAGMTALAALLVWKNGGAGVFLSPSSGAAADAGAEPVTWRRRGYWLLLAFIPSSLMLGVTTFLTTDIASAPMLWILPLSIYVGTFILVFARKPLLSQKVIARGFEISLILLIVKAVGFNMTPVSPFYLIPLHLILFFFAAMLCHTALAQARPHPSRLTEFYLIMSAGGALGGFFNAIIAPQVFVASLEYVLVLALAVAVYGSRGSWPDLRKIREYIKTLFRSRSLDFLFEPGLLLAATVMVAGAFAAGLGHKYVLYTCAAVVVGGILLLRNRPWMFVFLVCFTLALFPPGYYWGHIGFTRVVHQDRNFFGVIRIVDLNTGERVMLHGTTNHGAQALDEKYRLTPLSYYSFASPINDAFSYWNERPGAQNVAVVGLGAGVTACFSKPERHFDFFEIDSDIADIARNREYFTYLSDCGSPYDIILGDGRLTMQDRPDSHYDAILMDAFSSDNVPAHLLTEEAFSLYLQKLKPGGTIIVHISNNYLDLEPVVSRVAEKLGVRALARVGDEEKIKGTKLSSYPTHFMILTRSPEAAAWFESKGWTAGQFRDGIKSWSDQYSNILSVLGNKTSRGRFLALVEKKKAEEAAEKKASSP